MAKEQEIKMESGLHTAQGTVANAMSEEKAHFHPFFCPNESKSL